MCAGAIVQARVPRVVYATPDPKAGAVDTLFRLLDDARLNLGYYRIAILHQVGLLSRGSSAWNTTRLGVFT